jgi:glycosyltransferase involved in cell wall biosynthesis
MVGMPKISIITPVYCDISQKVDWLDEMIQSILSQTLIDWELILIDDKSPLPINSIAMKYEDEPRIRKTEPGVFFENAENSGPARTRNTAVGLAMSECILPLDSDDLLAGPEVLESMYDAWLVNPSVIIYGNLQQYTPIDSSGRFQRQEIIQLGEYSFELAMNLEGLMPVTAMHSKECHYQAGGWKASLAAGLEDVEYWIAAGKRGFCGEKINTTTLIYRRQEESRAYKLKHVNQQFRIMQNEIKQMHSDVYGGKFPMACCGKQTSAPINDPIVMSNQITSGVISTNLINSQGQSIDERYWKWKQYRGAKKGSFAKISRLTQIQYMIQGDGHTFPIHEKDEVMFRGTARDVFANVPDPRTVEPEPEPEPIIETPEVIEIPKPEMSTIIRLDAIAMGTVEADIQPLPPKVEPMSEVIIEPNPPLFVSDTMSGGYPLPSPKPQMSLHVNNLGLTEKLTILLNKNNWTVEKLAMAKPSELIPLSGIGEKRANSIIIKAKELISKT